jgi:hypothetical protein
MVGKLNVPRFLEQAEANPRSRDLARTGPTWLGSGISQIDSIPKPWAPGLWLEAAEWVRNSNRTGAAYVANAIDISLTSLIKRSARSRKGFSISRTDVISVLQSSASDSLDKYLAALAWRCGDSPREVRCAMQVFTAPDNADVLNEIRCFVHKVQTTDPRATWDAVHRGRRLAYLGTDFGTTVAYFAARSIADAAQLLPLPVNKRVEVATGFKFTGRPDDYFRFCEESTRAARAAAESTGGLLYRGDQLSQLITDLGAGIKIEQASATDRTALG